MDDDGGAGFIENFLESFEIEDVGADIADGGGKGGGSGWRGRDVYCSDGEAFCFEELGNNGCAKEAAASCNEDVYLVHW